MALLTGSSDVSTAHATSGGSRLREAAHPRQVTHAQRMVDCHSEGASEDSEKR
jgi:hypothetical protein